MINELRDVFLACLKQSERVVKKKTRLSPSETKFNASDFFKHWFRENGTNAFFIFRKNLSVTNIQYAELFSLIQANTYSESDSHLVSNLHFSSVDDFRKVLQELIDTFTTKETHQTPYEFIVKTYLAIFEKRIVVINFRGSCAVFFPPGLKLDLAAVCAHSGYVYCCGKSIYIRRVGKANEGEFLGAIKQYVKKVSKRKKVFFTVYAHEDFKPYDREHRESLSQGLESLKIHLEKFYMNKVRLVKVIDRIRENFSEKLFIPNPNNFREAHKKFRTEEKTVDLTKTLWLLADTRVNDVYDSTKSEKYYICYEQLYKNENQFQGFFDESKPAWIAPITIPHTLVSAMINLALPINQKKIRMIDPFVGTGTSWFEASKYSSIEVFGSDNSKATDLLVGDNLKFFTLSVEELRNLETVVAELCESTDAGINLFGRNNPPSISDANSDRLRRVRNMFFACFDRQKADDIQTFELSSKDLKKLRSADLVDRMLFYLALRAFLKNIGAYYRKPEEVHKDAESFWNKNVKSRYIKELENFYYQIQHLAYLKQRCQHPVESHDTYTVISGRYSLATTINFERFERLDPDRTIELCNAEKVKGKYHLVITDPPYGFNTDEDIEQLARLYKEFTRTALDCLKDNGQIVICLPEASHTGRRSPFFTHKEIFIKQVLSLAEDMDRELVLPAKIVPNPKRLFSPPYYWEAERSLRRTILHFRVRNRSRRSNSDRSIRSNPSGRPRKPGR